MKNDVEQPNARWGKAGESDRALGDVAGATRLQTDARVAKTIGAAGASGRRWLTVEQLIEIVPLRKSRVYYLTHTKRIPFVRVGKTLLFEYDAIVKWVESHGESARLSRSA